MKRMHRNLALLILAALLPSCRPAPPPVTAPPVRKVRPAKITTPTWCVVLDQQPHGMPGVPQDAVAAARARGFAGAAIYDTRQLTNLPWGLLAIIDATYRTETEARRAAVAAGKGDPPRVLRCVPDKGGAAPVTHPKSPPHWTRGDAGATLQPGCFGWSPYDGAAVCVTGRSSMQDGAKWQVTFPGLAKKSLTFFETERQVLERPPLRLQGKDQAALAKVLGGGIFYKLSGVPLDVAGAGEPAYKLERREKVVDRVDTMAGAWDVTRHRAVIKCASGKEYQVLESSIDGDGSIKIEALRPRGGPYVLFIINTSWAREGESGAELEVELVNLEEACAKAP